MARVFDFRKFEELYQAWELRFRLEGPEGTYSFLLGGKPCSYGTTDMVYCRAITGTLDLTEQERDAWGRAVNAFQDPRTGWFRKSYTAHFREHTTAYAVAALSLLGRKPSYPVRACGRIARSPAAMERWLGSVPWSIIWPASHIVSGLPAILHLSGEGTEEFFSRYFDWLDDRVEISTGFWSRGLAQRLRLIHKLSKEEMGGAFHMYYVYEARGRVWPLLERVVDASLALQRPNGFWDGEYPYCIDLDGLYCILRSSAHAGGYRADDARRACVSFLEGAERILCSKETLDRYYINSHRLPGALSAVAECARSFPELVRTERPWIQTLDRACFI